MSTLKVALYWTCKIPQGWKRYPAAIGAMVESAPDSRK
jgi:hypothetical protein